MFPVPDGRGFGMSAYSAGRPNGPPVAVVGLVEVGRAANMERGSYDPCAKSSLLHRFSLGILMTNIRDAESLDHIWRLERGLQPAWLRPRGRSEPGEAA